MVSVQGILSVFALTDMGNRNRPDPEPCHPSRKVAIPSKATGSPRLADSLNPRRVPIQKETCG